MAPFDYTCRVKIVSSRQQQVSNYVPIVPRHRLVKSFVASMVGGAMTHCDASDRFCRQWLRQCELLLITSIDSLSRRCLPKCRRLQWSPTMSELDTEGLVMCSKNPIIMLLF